MRRLLSIALTFIAVGAIASAAVAYYLFASFTGPGPSPEDKIIVIPKGTGVSEIAALLEREGVIESPAIFKLGVRLFSRQKPLLAGEYVFPKGTSPSAAIAVT